MEFQQLEMFAAVVEEGSIRQAAERVCRTAPAVSIALRKLQEEAGSALFDKSERYNYVLTPAGELLYSYVRKILEMRKQATSALRDLRHGRRGSVRIGTHESPSLYLLPLLAQAFHEIHPDLKIEVLSDNSERILGALKNREIDIALLAITPDDPDLEKNLIMRDELVLITNPAHRFARASEVHVSDLADEFMIVESPTSSLRKKVIEAFQRDGTRPNFGVENVTLETIKRMVAAGVGVGFVPMMCVREEQRRGELAVVRVKGLSHQRDLWLIHRNDRPLLDAAKAFVDVSLSIAQTFQPGEPSNGKARNLAGKIVPPLDTVTTLDTVKFDTRHRIRV